MTIRSTVTTMALTVVILAPGCSSDSRQESNESIDSSPATSVVESTATDVAPTDVAPTDVSATDVSATDVTTVPPVETSVPDTTAVPGLPTVFDFAEPASVETWRSQSDPVMGGVSTGSVAWAAGAMVFEGNLSLDNGGGFSSIVSSPFDPILAWSAGEGVSIELVGDGKTYVLQLRTSTGNWVERFDTVDGRPSTVTVAWDGFEPVDRFLEPVTSDSPLDPSQINTLAIYILDKQEGPFRLEVVSIS